MNRIAFIGTRALASIPAPLVALFENAAREVARTGAVVVTGAALGADQAAAQAALETGGRVELALPWGAYERSWVEAVRTEHPDKVSTVVYASDVHTAWSESVLRYHPLGRKLAPGAFALLARDYGIVAQADLVIALPRLPLARGGTAHGIRVARALGVPTLVLRDRTAQAWLQDHSVTVSVTVAHDVAARGAGQR